MQNFCGPILLNKETALEAKTKEMREVLLWKQYFARRKHPCHMSILQTMVLCAKPKLTAHKCHLFLQRVTERTCMVRCPASSLGKVLCQ